MSYYLLWEVAMRPQGSRRSSSDDSCTPPNCCSVMSPCMSVADRLGVEPPLPSAMEAGASGARPARSTGPGGAGPSAAADGRAAAAIGAPYGGRTRGGRGDRHPPVPPRRRRTEAPSSPIHASASPPNAGHSAVPNAGIGASSGSRSASRAATTSATRWLYVTAKRRNSSTAARCGVAAARGVAL
jgi:hypothetical protein